MVGWLVGVELAGLLTAPQQGLKQLAMDGCKTKKKRENSWGIAGRIVELVTAVERFECSSLISADICAYTDVL